MRIACIVLAAGKSLRFGSNKLLAWVEGVPLISRTLQAIPIPLFSQVVAVVSHPEVGQLCQTFCVEVCAYQGGPQSQSIRLGLEALEPADGCLFIMGDQPLCRPDSIQRLIDSFSSRPQAVHRLCYGGQPSSPTLFPAHLFPALKSLTGERGGMTVVGDTPVCYVEASAAYELCDTYTPEQLYDIRQHLQTHPL